MIVTLNTDPMIASAPLVVSQHLQTPRRWVILSPQGCHIVSLLRPVDVLKQLLINSQGAANEAVKYYFEVITKFVKCKYFNNHLRTNVKNIL